MFIRTTIGAGLLLALAGCDTGPYDPAAHRQAETSTGSRLSGVDTGVDSGDEAAGSHDPAIRVNTPGAAGYGG